MLSVVSAGTEGSRRRGAQPECAGVSLFRQTATLPGTIAGEMRRRKHNKLPESDRAPFDLVLEIYIDLNVQTAIPALVKCAVQTQLDAVSVSARV